MEHTFTEKQLSGLADIIMWSNNEDNVSTLAWHRMNALLQSGVYSDGDRAFLNEIVRMYNEHIRINK